MNQDALQLEQLNQLFELGKECFTTSLNTIIIICALASANRPGAISPIVKAHLKQMKDEEKKKKWVMMAQNALLKASFLCGMPRIINAMQSLMREVDDTTKSALPTAPREVDPNYLVRGEAMFNKVYSNVSERVKRNIGSSSPDLMAVILQDVYGRVLSDVTLLDEIETELVTIAVLIPLQVPAQLKGHLHGAKNVGATDEQIKAALAIGQGIVNITV